MTLCLPSGGSSLEEAEWIPYNADPTHAVKDAVTGAGAKLWRGTSKREPVNSDWVMWGSLREVHGPWRPVAGGTDSWKVGPLSGASLCLRYTS